MRAIFLFLPALLIFGCEKDPQVPTPVHPFVEFSNSFAGTYKGTLLKGWLGPSNLGPPPDTTYGFTDTISKAIDSDSCLFSAYVKEDMLFYTDSRKYCGNSYVQFPNKDLPRYDWCITFRNDSVYYHYGTGSWSYWSYVYFNGKKQ